MPNLKNFARCCETASIVGMSYWVSGYNWLHKLFWFAAVIAASIISLFIIKTTWEEWERNPTKTSAERVPLSEMTFPAVTVCPDKAQPWLAYQAILNQIEVTEEIEAMIPTSLDTSFQILMKEATTGTVLENQLFRHWIDELPMYEFDNIAQNFSSIFEEWIHKVDKLYMEDCEANGDYCNFHDKLIERLQAIYQDDRYQNWKRMTCADKRYCLWSSNDKSKYGGGMNGGGGNDEYDSDAMLHLLRTVSRSYIDTLAYPKEDFRQSLRGYLDFMDRREFQSTLTYWRWSNWTQSQNWMMPNSTATTSSAGETTSTLGTSTTTGGTTSSSSRDFEMVTGSTANSDPGSGSDQSQPFSYDDKGGFHDGPCSSQNESIVSKRNTSNLHHQILKNAIKLGTWGLEIMKQARNSTVCKTDFLDKFTKKFVNLRSILGGYHLFNWYYDTVADLNWMDTIEREVKEFKESSNSSEGTETCTNGRLIIDDDHIREMEALNLPSWRSSLFPDKIQYPSTDCAWDMDPISSMCWETMGSSRILNEKVYVTQTVSCNCLCNKVLKLEIWRIFKILQQPRVSRLGQVMAWLLKNHVMHGGEGIAGSDFITTMSYEDIVTRNLGDFVCDGEDQTIDNSVWRDIKDEIHTLETSIMTGLLGSSFPTTLYDFLFAITAGPDTVSDTKTFPRLYSWPTELRDEVYNFFNWSAEVHLSSLQFNNIPDFQDFNGTSFANLCNENDHNLPNYCKISRSSSMSGQASQNSTTTTETSAHSRAIDSQLLMEMLLYTVSPDLANNRLLMSDYKQVSDDSKLRWRSASSTDPENRLNLSPFCMFGKDTKQLYFGEADATGEFFARGDTLDQQWEKFKMNGSHAYRVPSCQMFHAMPSDLTMCKTFNGIGSGEIFKASSWLDKFNSFKKNEPMEEPKKVYGAGWEKGIVFGVDTMQHPSIAVDEYSTPSFHLKLHQPWEIPRLADKDLSSWTKISQFEENEIYHYHVKVSGEETSSTKRYKALAIETRQCLYSDEGDHIDSSTMLKHYTESNCLVECHWKFAAKTCGCKPWHVPAKNGEETCFYLGNICFQQMMTRLQEDDTLRAEVEDGCGCLPNCEFASYVMETEPTAGEEYLFYICDKMGSDGCEYANMKGLATTKMYEGVPESPWFNFAEYVLDKLGLVNPVDPFLLPSEKFRLKLGTDQAKTRTGTFIMLKVFVSGATKSYTRVTKDIVLSTLDKISWIGGTLGLFNGFCILSALELVYWSAMVLFGYPDKRVKSESCCDCKMRLKALEHDLEGQIGRMIDRAMGDQFRRRSLSPRDKQDQLFNALFQKSKTSELSVVD